MAYGLRYCAECGDVLDTDRLAGNAHEGDTICMACVVHLDALADDEDDADDTDASCPVMAGGL